MKSVIIGLRVSEEEKGEWQRHADDLGQTLTDFVKETVNARLMLSVPAESRASDCSPAAAERKLVQWRGAEVRNEVPESAPLCSACRKTGTSRLMCRDCRALASGDWTEPDAVLPDNIVPDWSATWWTDYNGES